MAFQDAMGLIGQLLTRAQALSAVTAHLRLLEMGETSDPALRAQLDRVLDLLGARELTEGLSVQERAILVGFARSYLRQAVELVEHPERPGAWSHDDPAVLQAQGAASAVVASLIAGAGLGREDARILDVGTGVARLAIAFAEAYPESEVVGIDPWQPALVLARENVAAAGLEGRITLLDTPIQRFQDAEGFDLVWLPSFFIPERVLDVGIENVGRSLRPGGTLVVGVSDVTEDDLTSAVDDLMTVRSGGTALSASEAVERLERAGFAPVSEVPRTWSAPIRLVAAHRSEGATRSRVRSAGARVRTPIPS